MEKEFVEWLVTKANAAPLPAGNHPLRIGIGDDAALVAPISDSIVIATDSIAEGTHFDLAVHSLERVGRKLLAVNLSDLAAMAAKPLYCTLNFQVPTRFTLSDLQQIYQGVETLANQHHVAIVGGDTNTWDGPLCLGATVIGSVEQPWRLSGALPNDSILVTGQLGGSLLGHHLDFDPRCEFALQISKKFAIHAATDITDSLSLDLHHMANASGVAAALDLDSVPVSTDAKTMCQSDPARSPLDRALTDGEDFELLLAVSKSDAAKILALDWGEVEVTEIGSFKEGSGLFQVDSNGNQTQLPVRGYCH